jgi:hypothetical protein
MEKTSKKTFTDYLRLWFKWVLDPLGGFLNRLGLTPNMVTGLGLLGNTIGAFGARRNVDGWDLDCIDDARGCIGWNDGAPARRIK